MRILLLLPLLFSLYWLRGCATEPSTTPVSGGAVFRHATGQGDIIASVKPGAKRGNDTMVAAFILKQDGLFASSIEEGTTVTFPATLTVTPPTGCTATQASYSYYTAYQLYFFSLNCNVGAGQSVSVTGTATSSRSGQSDRLLNGSATASPPSSSGLSFHTIFVTSNTTMGNLVGLAGADGFCASHAASGALTATLEGTWRAILSDASDSAASRLNLSDIPVKNVLDEVVVATSNNLWSGSLVNAVNFTENGDLNMAYTFTGSTSAGGILSNSHCNSWTSNSMFVGAGFGNTAATNTEWLHSTAPPASECLTNAVLYCINANN